MIIENDNSMKEKTNKVVKDIMGEALRDYINGIRNITFIHRDDGLCSREPIERYFKDYQQWNMIEQKILNTINGSVLEIGCNIGAHLNYLQNRGINTVGIDISSGAITIAKERGIKNCSIQDARKMAIEKKFDTILMLYYGFGLGGTIGEQEKLLKRLYQKTTPSGQIVCSSIDALKTDDPQHIAYQKFNKTHGKVYGDITQTTMRMQHGDKFGEWYDLLFINPNGLFKLVRNTGWKINQTIPEKEGGRAWYYILGKNK